LLGEDENWAQKEMLKVNDMLAQDEENVT